MASGFEIRAIFTRVGVVDAVCTSNILVEPIPEWIPRPNPDESMIPATIACRSLDDDSIAISQDSTGRSILARDRKIGLDVPTHIPLPASILNYILVHVDEMSASMAEQIQSLLPPTVRIGQSYEWLFFLGNSVGNNSTKFNLLCFRFQVDVETSMFGLLQSFIPSMNIAHIVGKYES